MSAMREDKRVGDEGCLAGKVALVTGGAQGIGKAITESFQQAGARVCILDCDQVIGSASAHKLTAANAATPVSFFPSDLANAGDITAAAEFVKRSYGRIDILVNNAGVELDRPFPEMTAILWENIMAVNLRAPFLLTQALVPLFPASGGAVINISSIHATHAFPDSTTYACSKAGLLALTRNLALELAPRGIRVNAVCPGYIDTRLWEEYARQAPDSEELASRTASLHPLQRRGLPKDVADAVLFLAAGGSSFITGTQLVVDGGLTVRAHS